MRPRLAVRIEKHTGRGGGGCGLAAIEAGDLVALGIVHQQKRTAADAGGFRFHERQHHLRSNCRIHGRAALAQHLQSCFRRLRMGGGDHVVARNSFARLRRPGCNAARENQSCKPESHPVLFPREVPFASLLAW